MPRSPSLLKRDAPVEGLVIVFDEPRRAPVLSFDGKHLSHVALAEGGRRAVMVQRSLTGEPLFYVHGLSSAEKPLWSATEIQQKLVEAYNEALDESTWDVDKIDLSDLPLPVRRALPH